MYYCKSFTLTDQSFAGATVLELWFSKLQGFQISFICSSESTKKILWQSLGVDFGDLVHQITSQITGSGTGPASAQLATPARYAAQAIEAATRAFLETSERGAGSALSDPNQC